MANTLYNSARGAFAQAQLHWLTDSFSVILVDTGVYTFSAAHTNLSQIPAGARVYTSALTGRSITASGGCAASNISLTALTGTYVGALAIYKAGGTEALSPLIAYIDTIPGLPFTPTGGNVLLSWGSSTDGIFRL